MTLGRKLRDNQMLRAEGEPMNAPKVFISYSHDSKEHKAWVAKLSGELRGKGVDVVLDQWELSLGQGVTLFMQRGVVWLHPTA